MDLRKHGYRVLLVHEYDFWDAVADTDPPPAEEREEGVMAANRGSGLVSALGRHLPELQALGWHVVLDESGCSLFRFFKNGTPRKKPAVSLSYTPFPTVDDWVDQEAAERSRPYTVRSVALRSPRAYSDVVRATGVFLAEARIQRPTGG